MFRVETLDEKFSISLPEMTSAELDILSENPSLGSTNLHY